MVLNADDTDFAADLFRVGAAKLLRRKAGELTCRHAHDASGRLKMRFGGLEVPEEAVVSVMIDGELVCEVLVHDGRGEFEMRSRRGDHLPDLAAGQVIEIHFEKQALLRGTVRSE
ncbi:MAG: hypothetical protein OER86_03190 [Phycisphaerae bacterium]|nr:hypothetical protein [Phycisphaerae bacterium]